MLFRHILSRVHQNQRNFCSLSNHGSSISSPLKQGISRSSSLENSLEKGHVISYLVNSCGLSAEKAISASKKVHFDSPDKPDAVLSFFKKQGFSKTQIAELVARRPQYLVSKPEKSLLPKIEFFSRLTGMSDEDVLKTVSRYPYILARSLEDKLAPIHDYLKDLIGAEKIGMLFKRGSWTFHLILEDRFIPNVDFLRELGVPQPCIERALFCCPEIFFSKHVEFRRIVEEVKRMGFDRTKSMFVLAIHARTGKGNLASWDECYEVYSKFGWSKDDILMAFRKHPNCMLCSEKKITAVLEFVVNELGRESRSVAKCPYVIFYNMERRIVPRCSVVNLLSLKGVVKKDWSLSGALCVAEEVFLDRFVRRYIEELPHLYDFYLSKKSQVTT